MTMSGAHCLWLGIGLSHVERRCEVYPSNKEEAQQFISNAPGIVKQLKATESTAIEHGVTRIYS